MIQVKIDLDDSQIVTCVRCGRVAPVEVLDATFDRQTRGWRATHWSYAHATGWFKVNVQRLGTTMAGEMKPGGGICPDCAPRVMTLLSEALRPNK